MGFCRRAVPKLRIEPPLLRLEAAQGQHRFGTAKLYNDGLAPLSITAFTCSSDW